LGGLCLAFIKLPIFASWRGIFAGWFGGWFESWHSTDQ